MVAARGRLLRTLPRDEADTICKRGQESTTERSKHVKDRWLRERAPVAADEPLRLIDWATHQIVDN